MVDATQRQALRRLFASDGAAFKLCQAPYVEDGDMFKLVCGEKGSVRQI